MKTNTKRASIHTHEGSVAKHINAEQQLRRSVMACMLWEDSFYESGEDIAARIRSSVALVKPDKVSEIAIEAREKMKLRHVPLFIANAMTELPLHKGSVANLLARIIQRADELSEFLAIYWKNGRHPLSAQVKKGLAKAFRKFSEYDLAKYNRDGAVKLRDVLFLCHAKPKDSEQETLWKRLIDGSLATPDTWEVALSSGADKKEAWTRLIKEKKLGALAYLRNLRNMKESGISTSLIVSGLESLSVERVLPFRFISAARYAPELEPHLEKLMFKCLEGKTKLPGETVIVVDGSGSMDDVISGKSELTRLDAACALAILCREMCENIRVIVFSNNAYIVPPRRGFALRDAIANKAERGGTNTQNALNLAGRYPYNRIIVITDEQSHQSITGPLPGSKGYFINVAQHENGIGYGEWTHIDGWSEAIVDYIQMAEGLAG